MIEPSLNSTQIQALHKASAKMQHFDAKVFWGTFIWGSTINALKFQTLFSFCSQIKCWLSGIGFTILVSIANREDPDLTVSDLDLPCLSGPFWQADNV